MSCSVIDRTESAFSFQKVIHGGRNSYTKLGDFSIAGGNGNNMVIFSGASSDIQNTILAKPSANRAVRIVSDNNADTMQIIVRGINNSGDAVNQTMTLNGTTNVTSSATMIMVNDIIPVSTYPAGVITVSLQYDGSSYTTLGQFNGSYRSTIHAVPNGRKLLVYRVSARNNTNTSTYMHLMLRSVKSWQAGNMRANVSAEIITNTSTWTSIELMGSSPMVFHAGDLVYVYESVGATMTKDVNYYYVEYDA